MLEDDANFGFLFSYIKNEDVFLQVGKERIVQEYNLPWKEISNFRKKVKPWIDAGMIFKSFGRNPSSPLEQDLIIL
jgi:hypothetical protein